MKEHLINNGSFVQASAKSTSDVDYIVAGAGCAGLSLVMHMIRSGAFADKQILLIDKDTKQSNDRTWCFWEIEDGLFQPVVYHQWDHLYVYGADLSRKLDIAPYRYKMIRGIDFYNYCLEEIDKHPNIQLLKAPVQHVFSTPKGTGVIVQDELIHADYVFNSILFGRPELNANEYWLLQHFKGWTIETETDCFDAATATLMDFRVDQQEGTSFCYVLPLSSRKALVEYTLFTKELLADAAYDNALRDYVQKVLGIRQYRVTDTEFGVIPMTNFRFEAYQNRIINLGTAGGYTKGSSGYTFQFIQKSAAAMVHQLINNGHPYPVQKGRRRFHFYDSVLLHILYNHTLPGDKIFSLLFKKNSPQQVLKFLDNETSLSEELSIISTLPAWPFLKAALRQF